MTIQNPQAFCEGLWDWAILDGCFGASKIKPTDIDGLVERNGYFLFIESKNTGAAVPEGQKILHKRLANTGVFTVIILWGDAANNAPHSIQIIHSAGETGIKNTDLEGFRSIVSRWYDSVNNKPPMERIDVSFLNKKIFVLEDRQTHARKLIEELAGAFGGKITW